MTVRKRKRRVRGSIDDKVLDGYFPPTFPGFLIAEEVKALVGTLRITVEELMEKLLPQAATRAITPVSGFSVGSVCRGESGNLYFGANIEFAGEALQATIHAEQAAIANAMAYGETGIKAMAVSSVPCGGCRQFMNELRGADALKIQVPNHGSRRLDMLFPSGFGPRDLGIETRMMDVQENPIRLVRHTNDKVILKAFESAVGSYAPHSGCYSAVALEIGRGFIFCGAYAENAAYNNSLQPLQAALAVLVIRAYRFADIKRAVLVQRQPARINLAESTRRLLQAVSDVPLEIALAEQIA